MRRPAALLPLLWLAACAQGGELSANAASANAASASADSAAAASETAGAGANGAMLDSATVRSAEAALSRWLSAAREGGATPPTLSLGTDPACDDGGGSWFPTSLLADFVLLQSETRGDTVVGRAEVITVAEQDVDRQARDRFVARQRVQRAVLEWDVVPTDDGSWAICNGLRFGYRGSDSLTSWRPEGSSYQSARRLADSVVAARQAALSPSSPP